MKLIRDVQISPDGQRVAYVVRSADKQRDRYASSIWLVAFDGGRATRLTEGLFEDDLPRWAPDGRWLAFTSDRADAKARRRRGSRPKNLFLLDLERGSLRQLTDFTEDVAHWAMYPVAPSLAWSPDGRKLCFNLRDPLSPGSPRPRAHVYEQLRYKLAEDGWLDSRRRHLWIVDVENGSLRQITSGDWDDFQPAWSPDATFLAFASNRADDERSDRNVRADIWLVRADGQNKPCRLTDASGPNLSPSFSPDGGSIAYFGHGDAYGSWSKNSHLWVRPVLGGEARDLLKGWDYPVGSTIMGDVHDVYAPPPPAWSQDGASLAFVATLNGTANLFEVDSTGGTPRPVTAGEHEIVLSSFDRTGRRFAALVSRADDPGDLHVGSAGELRRITNVNAPLLRRVRLCPAERITFTSGRFEIEGWVLKPPHWTEGRRCSLILQISPGPHFPHGHSFNFEYQLEAGTGHVVLYLNPRGIAGYGEAFIAARGQLWLGGDYDDYLAAVAHVVAMGYADERRIGVTGDAYGGLMTNWIISQTRRFAAAAARRGISNLMSFFGTSDKGASGNTMVLNAFGRSDPYSDPGPYLRHSPITYVKDIETPLLLIHSEGDLRCELGEAEQIYVALRYLNKPARLMVFHNETHFLSRVGSPGDRELFFTALLDWFDTHLGKAPDQPDH